MKSRSARAAQVSAAPVRWNSSASNEVQGLESIGARPLMLKHTRSSSGKQTDTCFCVAGTSSKCQKAGTSGAHLSRAAGAICRGSRQPHLALQPSVSNQTLHRLLQAPGSRRRCADLVHPL